MWTFLNPLFLWATAAVAIPLLLHLLQKRRTVKVPFSTLRFLQAAQRRSASRVRLENLLLWLLRTLLLLVLALAFALPVLRTTGLAGFLGVAQRDVAIVWDVSYSMTYQSGRQNVWDTSREAALGIIRGLHSGDRVCLFLADAEVTPLIEQPTSDLELARSLIKAQAPQPVSSRLRPAVDAAIAALKNSGSRERELYVITDGQALPWEDFASGTSGTGVSPVQSKPRPAPAGATPSQFPPTFVALLGSAHPQNTAVLDAEVQPTLLLTNSAPRILVKLTQTGGPLETTVTLVLDDVEVARRNATGELLFPLPPLAKGPHTVRLETAPDGLEIDNTFYMLLHVRDQLPVLVIGAEADAFFLSRALAPGAPTPWNTSRIDPAAPLPANLADFACVFLCNALPLPGQTVLDLERYVRSGGTLVVFPGENGAVADYASWQCLPAKPSGIADREPVRQPLRLDKPADPLFLNLKLPRGAMPAVTIHRVLTFADSKTPSPAPPEKGNGLRIPLLGRGQGKGAVPAVSAASASKPETIITAGPEPFLLRRKFGAGHVLLVTVAADRRWSDLPLSPFFLPLVHQFVHYAAGTSGERPFQWTAAELEVPLNVPALRRPDGQDVPLRAGEAAAGTHYLENARLPGLYRRGDEPVLALNFDRAESNLIPLENGQVPVPGAYVVRDTEELQRLIQQHRLGRPFSETLLWLALLLAVLELFLANRTGRSATKLTDRLTIHPSGRVLEKVAS